MSRATTVVTCAAALALTACGRLDFNSVAASAQTFVFDNASSTDLVGFPVLLALDRSSIDYAAITDPTHDLTFHDLATGAAVPFEIDHWDPSGESDVWVSMPTIHAFSQSDGVVMNVGHGIAAEDAAAVWAGNELVSHFESPSFDDSTGHGDSGTTNDVTIGPGLIGNAAQLTGISQRIDFVDGAQLFSSWNQFTIELWFRIDYASQAAIVGEPQFIEGNGPVDLGRVFIDSTNALLVQIDCHFTNDDSFLNHGVVTPGATYVAYTFDGQTLVMYVNGEPVMQQMFAAPEATAISAGSFAIGSNQVSIHGVVDELRIAKTARSGDWLRAQYASMTGRLIRHSEH